MTPKEKAKELFKNIYSKIFDIDNGEDVMQDKKRFDAAKNCAYIAIGEIISVCPYISKANADTTEQLRADNIMFVDYWQQVEKEIEAL